MDLPSNSPADAQKSFAKIEIPDSLLAKWQEIADLLAKHAEVPAALIMSVQAPEIEVLIASHSEGNPYEPHEKVSLGAGLYCETVMATREPLLVRDALKDPVWDHNPDIKLGMTFYYGFPLEWPDGDVFGTICILGSEDNEEAHASYQLLVLMKKVVESDLKRVFEGGG